MANAEPNPSPSQTLTINRRTGLRDAHLSDGMVVDPISNEGTDVSHVVLHSVSFRSPVPMPPGTVRSLRAGGQDARLNSGIRVVSCRLRSDGTYDVKAEFF